MFDMLLEFRANPFISTVPTDGHSVIFNRIKQLCDYRTSLQGKNSANISTETTQGKLATVFNLFLVWTECYYLLLLPVNYLHVLERRVPCFVAE